MTDLNSYVGKTLVHTAKAIRKGAPADRRFAVCAVDTDCGEPFLVAWKCQTKGDRMSHPAYPDELIAFDDPRAFNPGQAPNGAIPTATLRPDSYYQLVESTTAMGRGAASPGALSRRR